MAQKSLKRDPIIPLSGNDWEHVYEPAEDTFLFMDALEKELDDIKSASPGLIFELGCGSGCVSAFLATNLPGPAYIASDINPHAIDAARRTFTANQLHVDLLNMDLFSAFHFPSGIDVLLFNPPYVPTPHEEIESSWIARSWAGGEKGREVVDKVLEKIETILSPQGRLYMVALDSNDPHEVNSIRIALISTVTASPDAS